MTEQEREAAKKRLEDFKKANPNYFKEMYEAANRAVMKAAREHQEWEKQRKKQKEK
ncbi:MAG: hypothetical protein IJW31_08635 [Lentisphaeria bacterium]|nr:hypothetical protein [Lentisphaeria bacterium]